MLVQTEVDEKSVKTDLVKPLVAHAKKAPGKTKKPTEEVDDPDELEETPKKSRDEEDEETMEKPDDWEKPEEGDDDWDPDFEEFDLPASKKAKSGKADSDDDIKIEEDDEFKDLFNENDGGFDDEEEDF